MASLSPEEAYYGLMSRLMSKANDIQVGGGHYKGQVIQTWDFISRNNIPFLEGCAIKYLARWREKGGVADLLKAKHFIDKIIELEEEKSS